MENYLPIAILFLFGAGMGVVIIALSSFLVPRSSTSVKLTTYECGVTPEGSSRIPFKSRFYLIAVLFLLFDVEAVFFFPWALVYRESVKQDASLLVAMLAYMAFLVLGLVYVMRKNVLETDA